MTTKKRNPNPKQAATDPERECLTPGCGNKSTEGHFFGDLCAPCFNDFTAYKRDGRSCGPSAAKRIIDVLEASTRFVAGHI